MEQLTGKTAFITGGASGLGLGIAKACAKEGMNIVIADFRQKAIDEALPIFRDNGWTAHGIRLDVTDRAGYVKAADEAEAIFGKIHVLVNNAGIGIREGKVWEDDIQGRGPCHRHQLQGHPERHHDNRSPHSEARRRRSRRQHGV